MAPKRSTSKPPSSSSSSSSDDDDEEESEREPPPPTKNPIKSSNETRPKEKDSAADDSHSSSGEESDSDAETPPVKPVINSTKPMGETPNSSHKSPPKSSKSGKKPLTASEPESGIAKRNQFERFWSVDDEIKILEGIMEYHRNKGSDPASVVTSNALHSFMMSFLGSEFGKHQLGDKIQRLKSGYRRNASRGKDNGDPSFSKPHEKTKYELSKKIWGAKDASICEANDDDVEDNNYGNGGKHEEKKRKGSVSSVKSRKRKSKVVSGILDSGNNHSKEVDDGCSYEFIREAFGRMNDDVFKNLLVDNGLKLADPKKAKKLDEEFRKLSMVEMKLKLQGMDIVKEASNLLMEVLEKSG